MSLFGPRNVGRVDAAGHGEDLAVLLQRQVRRDHGAALEVAFDHQHAQADAAHDAIAPREELAARLRAERVVGDEGAVLGYLLRQLHVLRRVDHVQPAGHDGDGPPAGAQGRAMRHGVDAARQAADDGHVVADEVGRELLDDLAAVGRGPPRADDGDGPLVGAIELAADVEDGREVVDLLQLRRVGRVVPGQGVDVGALQRVRARRRAISPAVTTTMDVTDARSRPAARSSAAEAVQAFSSVPKCFSRREKRARPMRGMRPKATQYLRSCRGLAVHRRAF